MTFLLFDEPPEVTGMFIIGDKQLMVKCKLLVAKVIECKRHGQ